MSVPIPADLAIKFGDGCDIDTLRRMLRGIKGWVIRVGGVDVFLDGVVQDEEARTWALSVCSAVRLADADELTPSGDPYTVPLVDGSTTSIYIY